MAGYSGTPLTKKLGIKEGSRIVFANAPKGFEQELGELPPRVHFVTRAGKPIDMILLFAKSHSGLKKDFVKMAKEAFAQRHVMGSLAEEELGRCD